MIKVERVEPGSDWSDEDRFNVIADLAVNLRDISRSQSIRKEIVYECAERIVRVVAESSEFLEANRDAILNGQEWSR